MEYLSGATLVNKSKSTIPADEALKDAEIIGFYFSAHWCPPCRMFTPILADFYKEAKDSKLPLEIIFVSSDKSEDALFAYMNEAHGDWLAVPFDSPAVKQLDQEFSIEGIPTLVIVKKDGTVVNNDALSDVEEKGIAAFKEWIK